MNMTARVRRRRSVPWYAAWVQYRGMFTIVWKPFEVRAERLANPRRSQQPAETKKKERKKKTHWDVSVPNSASWGCFQFKFGSVWWQDDWIELTFTSVAVFTLLWSRCYLLLFGFFVNRCPTDCFFLKFYLKDQTLVQTFMTFLLLPHRGSKAKHHFSISGTESNRDKYVSSIARFDIVS